MLLKEVFFFITYISRRSGHIRHAGPHGEALGLGQEAGEGARGGLRPEL